ncbi:hypothetical protein [Streptacidiphilus cavernicola]|uniref:Uncharacterized protein n=1 Tax=Streptacidiphilus cavernicola TaxID=3342716 RepID=A0ABV6VWV6_9ACTN
MTVANPPGIGDLVQDSDGRQLVVTDLRSGQLILRALRGSREQPVEDPTVLTILARRGTWGGYPDGQARG